MRLPNNTSVGKAAKDKAKEKKDKAAPSANGNGASANGKGASGKGGKGAAPKEGPGNYTNSAFAEFDRFYAGQAEEKKAAQKAKEREAAEAAAAAARAVQVDGGKFAGLADREERGGRAAPRGSDSDAGSDAGVPAASAGAAPKKAKAPKAPKKPRVTVAAVAAGVDVGAVQEAIAGLQQRYAGNEASQVEVLADSVAKMFKEAQVGGGGVEGAVCLCVCGGGEGAWRSA